MACVPYPQRRTPPPPPPPRFSRGGFWPSLGDRQTAKCRLWHPASMPASQLWLGRIVRREIELYPWDSLLRRLGLAGTPFTSPMPLPLSSAHFFVSTHGTRMRPAHQPTYRDQPANRDNPQKQYPRCQFTGPPMPQQDCQTIGNPLAEQNHRRDDRTRRREHRHRHEGRRQQPTLDRQFQRSPAG